MEVQVQQVMYQKSPTNRNVLPELNVLTNSVFCNGFYQNRGSNIGIPFFLMHLRCTIFVTYSSSPREESFVLRPFVTYENTTLLPWSLLRKSTG